MTEYDNTNRGAAFPPLESQAMILTGKIDVDGENNPIVMVKDTDRNGQAVISVYKRMGVLYENEKATPENKQPKYKGPASGGKRLSAWKQSGNNGDFLSLRIENAQPKQEAPAQMSPATEAMDDEMPF